MSDIIQADLAPLFAKADAENLWFFCNYQQLWFSPNELREFHAKGQFLWGAVNWKLRHPGERLLEIARQKSDLDAEAARFSQRIEDSRK